MVEKTAIITLFLTEAVSNSSNDCVNHTDLALYYHTQYHCLFFLFIVS